MEIKTCTACKRDIILEDFYWNGARQRAECKACTIKRNWAYTKKHKTWKKRTPHRIEYLKNYYRKRKGERQQTSHTTKQRTEN